MACLIGVSSLYQTPARVSHSTAETVAHPVGIFKPTVTLRCARPATSLFVVSAIATSSSMLSEEAFKGVVGGFGKEDVESDYESEDEFDNEIDDGVVEEASEDVLAIDNLGLPKPLVESLQKRGITDLFPIQVFCTLLLFLFFFPRYNYKL